MFRRRTSLDRDAVAIARQRLAALTAQLTPVDARERAVPDETTELAAGVERAAPPPPRGDPDVEATRWPPPSPAGRVPPPVEPDVAPPAGRHRSGSRALLGPGRWTLDPHHVAVTAVLLLVLTLVGVWWVLRSMPHQEPLPLKSTRTLPQSPAASGGSPSAEAETMQPFAGAAGAAAGGVGPAGSTPGGAVPAGISSAGVTTPTSPGALVVVDVAGRVRRPGIVELPPGSRVADAISAAGGIRTGVNTTRINLARQLVDGEQILVGVKAAPSGVLPSPAALPPPSAAATTGLPLGILDLNTASEAELETLPGVGPVTANAILAWRSENGAFTSVDELLEISGIGDATLAKIAPYVHV